MALINWLAGVWYSDRYRQMDRMATEGPAIQAEQLAHILREGSRTKFGAEHGLRPDMGYDEFARAVSVTDYEGFRPYAERMIGGEADVTWPGRVRWFAKSSGTSGSKSKFIPVTSEGLSHCHLRGTNDAVATYMRLHPDTRAWRGKCLTLGGSKRLTDTGAGSQTGDLSAIMIGNAPLWSELFKTPRKEVALLSEWEEKMERIAAETERQDVTSMAGVPSWMMVLIKRIMERRGARTIAEVWPNLELFIHGGIGFEPYRAQYDALCPRGMRYMETYNASEGFFGIQTDPADRAMSLMLDYGTFYEFLPLSEAGKEKPEGAVPLSGVETGVDYAMVITSVNGLWRYMIGDTVSFTGLAPYRFVISGRTRLFINAFGEEVMIGNAEAAMSRACRETGAVVSEYTAAPVFMGRETRGRHEWMVEFDTPPADMGDFAARLDKALQAVNSDYEAKRYKDITLAPPDVHAAPRGLFDAWLRSKGKMGGQNKVPRLRNDRALMDELKEMARTMAGGKEKK